MAEKFYDSMYYEVTNPNTGRVESWSGERIKAFKVAYRVDIELAPPPERPTAKKRSSRKKKTT